MENPDSPPTTGEASPDVLAKDTTSSHNGTKEQPTSSLLSPRPVYTHDDVAPTEEAAVEEMLQALTPAQIESLPDDHMPLRHLRAEKVPSKKETTLPVPGSCHYFSLTNLSLFVLFPLFPFLTTSV